MPCFDVAIQIGFSKFFPFFFLELDFLSKPSARARLTSLPSSSNLPENALAALVNAVSTKFRRLCERIQRTVCCRCESFFGLTNSQHAHHVLVITAKDTHISTLSVFARITLFTDLPHILHKKNTTPFFNAPVSRFIEDEECNHSGQGDGYAFAKNRWLSF